MGWLSDIYPPPIIKDSNTFDMSNLFPDGYPDDCIVRQIARLKQGSESIYHTLVAYILRVKQTDGTFVYSLLDCNICPSFTHKSGKTLLAWATIRCTGNGVYLEVREEIKYVT